MRKLAAKRAWVCSIDTALSYCSDHKAGLPDSAKDVRFTPTFTFYRKGKKIDEITKTTPRGLRDHAWMHADDAPDDVARP